MLGQDIVAVLQWWGAWLALGIVGWGWGRRWLPYVFGKAVGIAIVTLVVWLLGSFKIVPFGDLSVFMVAVGLGIIGWLLPGKKTEVNWKQILTVELVFGAALFFWAWIKAHEPSINGLEKFMDYGFTKSILSSQYFPPADMWYAGKPINYYYFGHLMMAVMTKLSQVDFAIGFNLMLVSTFALCLTMSGGIAAKLLAGLSGLRYYLGIGLTALLVTVSGNLQTIYIFTSGYSGEEPIPFWQILKWGQWSTYWYPNATRFIPYTIHEFPAYSFVVSDMHGHVLDIPLVLLAIAILVEMWLTREKIEMKMIAAYGVLVGTLMMTNALDGPIYLGLFGLLILWRDWPKSVSWKWFYGFLAKLSIVVVSFGLTIAPFVLNFEPFVSGVAVNCPPAALAGQKYGPIIFETVDKCQRSPIWMMLLLWGMFVYTGIWNMFAKEKNRVTQLIGVLSLFCLGLIIFPEIFYFKDIYPMHFRSNTMFKLGYQVFIIMSLASGYVISTTKNKFFKLGVVPLLFLVLTYPTFAVRSYFGGLKNYQGLYGLDWFDTRYPDDKKVVDYLDENYEPGKKPVILEASGDSYTDANRISAFSGTPTVAGWLVHEWLWRGGYEPISKRVEEVRMVYETQEPAVAEAILDKYGVELVIVGGGEREKYANLNEEKFSSMGRVVFESGTTRVYRLRNL